MQQVAPEDTACPRVLPHNLCFTHFNSRFSIPTRYSNLSKRLQTGPDGPKPACHP